MLNFLAFVLRVYSFVFHLTLSVFLLGVGVIAYRSTQPFEVALKLNMLPFETDVFARDTMLLGIIGLFCTLIALTRWFKFLFFLWAALVLCLMVKWFFLGVDVFDNSHQTRGALWLTFGCVGAFFGAGWSLKTRKRLALL